MVCGRYVPTFAEASHALPDDMHMDADYPFMIPAIVSVVGDIVTIRGSGGKETSFPIERETRGKATRGWQIGYIRQSSSFERLFNRPPHRFKMRPFKDEKTPAIGDGQGTLPGH